MNYYRRYVGDYLRDTSKLSLLEHGAYSILLDHYYAEERPISLDLDEVYRQCRAITPEERRAVVKVLTRYFSKSEDGYHNKRADEEIAAAVKARANGAKGGRPRTEEETDELTGSVTGAVTGKGGGSGHPPTTNLQPPAATRQNRSAAGAALAGFEEAWKALPKRAGNNPKRRAERAYRARLAEGCTAEEILAGAQRYARFAAATGKAGSEYVMQGATFFGPEQPFRQSWIVVTNAADWRRSPDAMLAKAKELGISTRGLDARQLEQEIQTRLSR